MSASPASVGRGVLIGAVTLLAILLPVLAAGARIERPAGEGELARVAAAAADPRGTGGGVADLFYAPFADADPKADPPRARFGSLLGMLAISGFLYAAVMQARGRGQAVLSCIALACLPPVAVDGAIVRPEIPATMFGMLAVAMLAGLPIRLAAARRARRKVIGQLWVLALAIAVGTAEGLAVAALPALGVSLLVPAGCLLIAVAQHGLGWLAALRRFRLLVLPSRAFALRVAPWLCAAFAGMVAGALLLGEIASPPRTTPSDAGLWPHAAWAAVPLVALAIVGGLVWIVGVGLRIGRRRRLTPELVLAVYVLALLVYRVKADGGDDALPSTPALAVVIAEGARVVLLFAGAGLNRALSR